MNARFPRAGLWGSPGGDPALRTVSPCECGTTSHNAPLTSASPRPAPRARGVDTLAPSSREPKRVPEPAAQSTPTSPCCAAPGAGVLCPGSSPPTSPSGPPPSLPPNLGPCAAKALCILQELRAQGTEWPWRAPPAGVLGSRGRSPHARPSGRGTRTAPAHLARAGPGGAGGRRRWRWRRARGPPAAPAAGAPRRAAGGSGGRSRSARCRRRTAGPRAARTSGSSRSPARAPARRSRRAGARTGPERGRRRVRSARPGPRPPPRPRPAPQAARGAAPARPARRPGARGASAAWRPLRGSAAQPGLLLSAGTGWRRSARAAGAEELGAEELGAGSWERSGRRSDFSAAPPGSHLAARARRPLYRSPSGRGHAPERRAGVGGDGGGKAQTRLRGPVHRSGLRVRSAAARAPAPRGHARRPATAVPRTQALPSPTHPGALATPASPPAPATLGSPPPFSVCVPGGGRPRACVRETGERCSSPGALCKVSQVQG